MIKLGHRHIGYLDLSNDVSLENQLHYSVKDSYAGACAAVEDADSGVKLEIMNSDGIGRGNRLEFMRDLLQRHDYPRAIITVSYRHALTCLHAALSLGIRVPEDLSIVTFYDKSIYDESGLAFDTVAVPEIEMGFAAVKMLMNKINQKECRLPRICLDMPFTTGNTCTHPLC